MLGDHALGVGAFRKLVPPLVPPRVGAYFGNTLLLGCDLTRPNKCCVPLPLWSIHMALVIAWVFMFLVVKIFQ
jgi:hypothetical protein